ncbi:MAG TPA: RagB/SusD family nutrient uptake outer membrane protein [Hanamia sp.]|nr:RagB/SusD family nutrient uptake outer membrane protein [Hanamia sp.]
MKNILLFICGFSLMMISCKKSFLEVPIQGQGTPSTDPQVALNDVTGAYNALITPDPTQSEFGQYDIHGIYFITVTNIMSDDADKGSYPGDQPLAGDIDNFIETSDNTYVAGLWRGYYAGISRTNIAISGLAQALLPASQITRLTAEMRFLRGYFYFNMVRMFGGVPLVLTVPSGPQSQDSSFYIRASVSDVYNKGIIPDLQFAVSNLPLKSATDVGRATKGAAETLLAKVDMYLKNWQQADSLTTDVINSGQYHLMPDYSILWRQAGDNCAESVFEVETGIYGNADYGIPGYVEFQGPRQDNGMGTPSPPWNNPGFNQPSGDDGYGFDAPSASLMAAYEPGDLRKAATIISLPASSAPDTLFDGFVVPAMVGVSANYNYKAYHSQILPGGSIPQVEAFDGNRSLCQKNLHILRYAEVLLIKAEAANELGNSGTAIGYLNMVRARAGLPPTNAVSQSDVRTAIWKERRVELAMEHDRFWDLVRQGRAAQVMIADGKTNFVAGKSELLPIPSSEIAISGGRLTQNPGY